MNPWQAYQNSTHHGSIEKCIVKFWVCRQQLAPQKFGVVDVLEESYLHGVGLVVRQREGPNRGHGSRNGLVWSVRACPVVVLRLSKCAGCPCGSSPSGLGALNFDYDAQS